VEDLSTLAMLNALDCDECQGYYFAPPLAVPGLERWLATRATGSGFGRQRAVELCDASMDRVLDLGR
jgi:hypothetical protein